MFGNKTLAPCYCPRQQPAKYLRRRNVSPPSSGWSRCGSIAPTAPGKLVRWAEPRRLHSKKRNQKLVSRNTKEFV